MSGEAVHAFGFCIPHEHPCLPGHFPGRPVVPGVVVLDHVLGAAEAWLGQPFSALTLSQVKFVQPLLPGQRAEGEFSRTGPRLRFRLAHAGATLASGEFGPVP